MKRQRTKFGAWMDERGYTCEQLGHELDYSHHMIYAFAIGRRRLNTELQIKFVNRFGREEAAKVFDDSPILALLETI